jgi:hypothetical protein
MNKSLEQIQEMDIGDCGDAQYGILNFITKKK